MQVSNIEKFDFRGMYPSYQGYEKYTNLNDEKFVPQNAISQALSQPPEKYAN